MTFYQSSDLPRLQALILLADVFTDGKWISQHLPVRDSRVVVKTNWELERGSKCFWARAETFVTRKQRGEIEGRGRFLFNLEFF
jgi:hypothetical protein